MNGIKQIEKKLRAGGYKLTEQRKAIIEILSKNSEHSEHYTAQIIFEQSKEKCENINFSTIYRNLELLTKLNIIDKLNLSTGTNYYEMNSIGHHHHIICKGCGEVKKIDICPYHNLQTEVLDKHEFSVTEHVFEIYGYCSKCNKK